MPSTRASGADVLFLAAFEAAYAVAPTTGLHRLLLGSYDPGEQDNMAYDPELGMGDEEADPYFDGERYRPTFNVHVGIESFGIWAKALLGAPVTTGAGPYTHVFGSTGDPPSLFFEEGDAGLTVPVFWRQAGIKMGGMTMDLSPKGVAKANFTAFAKNRKDFAASIEEDVVDAPTEFPVAGVYKYFNANLKAQWNGADLGNVLGGNLNYTTNSAEIEELGQNGEIGGVEDGAHGATGELRVRRSIDTSLRADAKSKTPRALKFIWSTPANAAFKLELHFPRTYVQRRGGGISGPDGIEDTYGFRAARPAGDRLMKLTLINSSAAAAYA